MRWEEVGTQPCPIARGLAVVGDRWTLLLVRELFLGTRRFDRFQAYTGMAPALLTERLNRLTEAGVVERFLYQESPPRREYRLTPKGLELYPILVSLAQWGERHGGWQGEPSTELVHRDCGQAMTPCIGLTCSACGEGLGPRDVRVTRRPDAVLEVGSGERTSRRKGGED